MKHAIIMRLPLPSLLILVLAALAGPVFAQQPTAAERAAMVKATLAASQVLLRQYEWIETTSVSVKGEEKSRKQERCYYGADGGVQKVLLNESAPPPRKRGFLRRKIAESKQEELTDYLKNAVGLVKSYVPPSPAKIQAAKEMGKVSIDLLQSGRRARLNFQDYERPGDTLSVELDLASNRVTGLKVATYLEDASDAVTLEVRMGQLNDGATYPANVKLEAKAKKVTVTVENSGYRKTS